MTVSLKYSELFTEFDRWINKHPELDASKQGLYVMNVDKVFFLFRLPGVMKLLLLEYKQGGAECDEHQTEVIEVLDCILKHAMKTGLSIPTLRGDKKLLYYGYHVLCMSGASPEDSEWMTWDDVKIDENDLVKLLRCEKIVGL